MSVEEVTKVLEKAAEVEQQAQVNELAKALKANNTTQEQVQSTQTTENSTQQAVNAPATPDQPTPTTENVKDKTYAELAAKAHEPSLSLNLIVTEALKEFGEKVPVDKITEVSAIAMEWAKRQIAEEVIDPMSFNKAVRNSVKMYLSDEVQREEKTRDAIATKDAELLNAAANYFAPVDLHSAKRAFEESYAAAIGYSVEDMRRIVSKDAYVKALTAYRTSGAVKLPGVTTAQTKSEGEECLDFIINHNKNRLKR